MNKIIIASAICVTALFASGSGSGGTTAPNAAEVSISSATIPSPGVVQVQFKLTEPRPIMSTGTGFDMDGLSALGISVWTPTGEACGVGPIVNGKLRFTAIDPTGTLGTALDYPFITVTMGIPKGIKTGTVLPFNWSPDAWLSDNGTPYSLTLKPGSLTIGGSVSISGILPGGGTWPAGTVVRIQGSGFSSGSRLRTNVKFTSISIQPTEIQIVLKETTLLDSQQFVVQNPDNSQASYFAYLRGVNYRTPSKGLLQNAEYAFPMATHAIATLDPSPVMTGSQYQALALQNPTTGPAAVTLTLNGGQTALFVLGSGVRLVDTVSALFNGTKILPGDVVTLTSTAMIQIMGVNADDSTSTLTPFIPTF